MEIQKQVDQGEENFDEEQEEELQTVAAKTAKEMKAMYRPIFRETPQKYYPTKVFDKYGFTRAECKCGTIYWRRTEARDTCGDSECVGKYTFIGKGFGMGKGPEGKKITYAEAWKIYRKQFEEKNEVKCTAIDRYPVVARWRNDVDYVAAGIFCFQPYCVTGELDPPANPLIQPQFCLRFNDLDNVGVSGRHYSGFVMVGNQVFNYPKQYNYFDEECVEYHINWLQSMDCDLDEVTLVEDVWSGGGNLGSSIEIFAHGLEIGNMVFTRYKYFPSGEIEELDVKVIDVGLGLERIPWIINGDATSYESVYDESLNFLKQKLQVSQNAEIWNKFMPYACLLNVDEAEDIKVTWQKIAENCELELEVLQQEIQPVKEMYVICDHSRTAFMAIYDGSLPSNVGGGSNIRNILRNSFAILKKNDWWVKIGGIDGFLELLEMHRRDLSKLYGEFPEYKSFVEIIKKEYDGWQSTDKGSLTKLDQLKNKRKDKILQIDDWIRAVQTFGIPADKIVEHTKQPIPPNFWYELDLLKTKTTKQQAAVLYNTAHLPETVNLYYEDHKQLDFQTQIQEVFVNQDKKYQDQKNIIILEGSAFYPTSGGQQHDIGIIQFEGETYNVINVEKVGKSVLHIIDRNLEKPNDYYIGKTVSAKVDSERRNILRNHHTACHLIFASCRQVLGPHVWQNGAKKTTEMAHLDITHFQRITPEQETEIEDAANRLIKEDHNIDKRIIDKAEAEREHGFRLYQGGIVPGNKLRVVNIANTDVEACCGTHCDSTSEVGFIKLLKTTRIQDGIVRLYFVAGQRAIERMNNQSKILGNISKLLLTNEREIYQKVNTINQSDKRLGVESQKQQETIRKLRLEGAISNTAQPLQIFKAFEQEYGLYISTIKNYIQKQQENGQGIIFLGKNKVQPVKRPDAKGKSQNVKQTVDGVEKLLEKEQRFIIGQFGKKELFDFNAFYQHIKEKHDPDAFINGDKVAEQIAVGKTKYQGVLQFIVIGQINETKLLTYLKSVNFQEGI